MLCVYELSECRGVRVGPGVRHASGMAYDRRHVRVWCVGLVGICWEHCAAGHRCTARRKLPRDTRAEAPLAMLRRPWRCRHVKLQCTQQPAASPAQPCCSAAAGIRCRISHSECRSCASDC
eukprot:scaffold13220_cov113-Isochrysis_galbana.AAC.7